MNAKTAKLARKLGRKLNGEDCIIKISKKLKKAYDSLSADDKARAKVEITTELAK